MVIVSRERGSAALIVVGLTLVAMAATLGLAQVVSAAVAAARADTVAAVAAIHGAARGPGTDEPCAAVAVLVQNNRGRLVRCAVVDDYIEIEVAVAVSRRFGAVFPPVRAVAAAEWISSSGAPRRRGSPRRAAPPRR